MKREAKNQFWCVTINAMTRNQLFIVTGLTVFTAIIITVGIVNKNTGTNTVAPIPSAEQNSAGLDILKTTTTSATYSKEIPKDAAPTVPVVSAPAAENSTAQYGVFKITIDKDGFHPNSLIVVKGNIVKIEATSLDGDYDMWIPKKEMYWAIKKGETKPFTFTALEVGTFLFKCRDFCPSGKVFEGTIITK